MTTLEAEQAAQRRRVNALYALANTVENIGEQLSDLSTEPLGQIPAIVRTAIKDLEGALAALKRTEPKSGGEP